MNQDVALWALGILCALVGTLGTIVLTRVQRQGDDTNRKVTAQGESMARMETLAASLDRHVQSLLQWRNDVQQREITSKEAEILELRRERDADDRRNGLPDRRA